MITILKHGKRAVTECESCKCRFSFEKEDVLKFGKHTVMVECPECRMPCIVCGKWWK